jgi:hypothetical protein
MSMTDDIVTSETFLDPTILSFPRWMPLVLRTELKQYVACAKSLVLLKEQQDAKEGGLGYHEFLQQRIDQAQSFMSLMESRYV